MSNLESRTFIRESFYWRYHAIILLFFCSKIHFTRFFNKFRSRLHRSKENLIRYTNQSRVHSVNPLNSSNCTWPALGSVNHSSPIQCHTRLHQLESDLQVFPFPVNLSKFENIQTIRIVWHTTPASHIEVVKYRTRLRRLMFSPQDAKLCPSLGDTISRLQQSTLDLGCPCESIRLPLGKLVMKWTKFTFKMYFG